MWELTNPLTLTLTLTLTTEHYSSQMMKHKMSVTKHMLFTCSF